jgi:hypothetical protein
MVNLTQIKKGLNNMGSKLDSPEVKAALNILPNNQRKAANNALNIAKKAAGNLRKANIPTTPANMSKMVGMMTKPNN